MAVGDAYVFPGFLTPVLTLLFFQSHRLLFSHASAEVRGENTPERKVASTWDRTHNHQVMSPTRSPLSHPGGYPLLYTYTRAKHPLRTLLECSIQTLFRNLFLTLSFQCSCTEESLKFLWQKGGTPRYKQFHPLPQHFVCCIKSNIHNYHK